MVHADWGVRYTFLGGCGDKSWEVICSTPFHASAVLDQGLDGTLDLPGEGGD